MNLVKWRDKMELIFGTRNPEPPYIVYHGIEPESCHQTLAEALNSVKDIGGVIYERLGSSIIKDEIEI